MTSSLIPERPLLISPTLAATIGLEESILLHVISELLLQHTAINRDQRLWGEIDQAALIKAMPFWHINDIKRIQQNLKEKGLLLTEISTNNSAAELYAINQPQTNNKVGTQVDSTANTQYSKNVVAMPLKDKKQPYSVFNAQENKPGKTLISPHWQPSETLFQLCQQHNIPQAFIEQRVKTFVMYWHERGDTQFSWHNTFLKWIVAEWRKDQSFKGGKELETNMSAQWQPSGDALSILDHAGVNSSFVEDAIPEFILYWRERGLITSMWNTKFIAHIRRQWGKFTLALEHDNTPRLIPDDYQPSTPCYEVLAMANIDLEFAQNQVKEFIMYWQERKEPCPSWNTKFLQHVKFRWANQGQSDQPLIEKITDRSWAE